MNALRTSRIARPASASPSRSARSASSVCRPESTSAHPPSPSTRYALTMRSAGIGSGTWMRLTPGATRSLTLSGARRPGDAFLALTLLVRPHRLDVREDRVDLVGAEPILERRHLHR